MVKSLNFIPRLLANCSTASIAKAVVNPLPDVKAISVVAAVVQLRVTIEVYPPIPTIVHP